MQREKIKKIEEKSESSEGGRIYVKSTSRWEKNVEYISYHIFNLASPPTLSVSHWVCLLYLNLSHEWVRGIFNCWTPEQSGPGHLWNDVSPMSFGYLNTWSPAADDAWRGLGSMALQEEVCQSLRAGSEVSKPQHSQVALFLFAAWDVTPQHSASV